jgi:hypothetical protein
MESSLLRLMIGIKYTLICLQEYFSDKNITASLSTKNGTSQYHLDSVNPKGPAKRIKHNLYLTTINMSLI